MLAHGAERKKSRKADLDALAIIEQTGTTKETLANLQAMVDTAQSVGGTTEAATTAVDQEAMRIATLRRIHAWVTAWSEMARTVLTRRDQMIRLGIAKRRPPKAKAGATPPVAVPPATPVSPVAGITPLAPAPMPVASLDEHGPESRAA